MTTTKTKPAPKGAQLADDLADLFPLVPDSDRWGSYFNQADEPGDDSIDAWQQREARFLALVNSAPELLEALKEMDRAHAVMCEAIPHGKFPTAKLEAAGVPSGFMSRVHAAIAKATGQN